MTDVRLPQHGRDHRPGGSDPIEGIDDFIRFNHDNQGQDDGHLEITARGSVPGGDDAIVIRALAENGGAGDLQLEAEGNFYVDAPAAQITVDAFVMTAPDFLMSTFSFDGMRMRIVNSGGTFVIEDHLGAALVTYTG